MADQIDFIVADLAEYTRGEIVALALNVNANLREDPSRGGTPIDTGWASANWVPSIGEPAILNGRPAAKEGPTPAEVTARAQIADKGTNEVLSWRNEDGPIFSTNNVPYILPLNEGHSPQAIRGFVQIAMEKAITQTYSRAATRNTRQRRQTAAKARKPRPIR